MEKSVSKKRCFNKKKVFQQKKVFQKKSVPKKKVFPKKTPFHLVLVKLAPVFKTGLSIVFQTRSDQLRAARSYPSGTVVLFSVKAILAEPAGTCSIAAVPASRIPTRCVGIVNSCDDSGVLMLSTKLGPQSSGSV